MRILLPAHEAGSGGLGSTIRGLCASIPEALPEGDELVVLGGVGPDGSWQRPARRLSRLLQEQFVVARAARGFDLVHLPDHRPLLASRTPFLLTVHDVLYLDHPEWFPPAVRRYKRVMLQAAVRKGPAMVVVVSEYTRERFTAHFPSFPEERIRVIYPGISPPENVDGSTPSGYFLTVSTIEPRKNHLGLLQAFHAARAQGLELRWTIVGAPGYAAGPIAAELGADPGVELLGWVGQPELERLYRGARFLAVPSLGEGFGMPPLEAMARGIPVLSASGTSLDESVGDAALRVEPTDESGWTNGLLRLASDEGERARLIRAGLERAEGFTWPRAAARYVEAYRAAVS
jgi:glycosyltransferase involved in cell wall biosynthesis